MIGSDTILSRIVILLLGLTIALGSIVLIVYSKDFFTSTNQFEPNTSTVKNIGVCIIGQMARLETSSKILNFISPNNFENRRLHVVGLLDEGQAYYSNGPHHRDEECYDNTTDMKAFFDHSFSAINVSSQLRLSQPRDFPLSQRTMKALRNYRRKLYGKDRLTRIQGHLRQFAHDARCYESLRKHEVANNLTFDAVLRIRDNGLVIRPFDLIKLMESVQYSQTITRDCMEWGGVNDKVWLIPRVHMKGALAHLTRDVLAGRHYIIAAKPKNSETLVKAVWKHYGVDSIAVSPEMLPVVDGRCHSSGNNSQPPQFLTVPVDKDCGVDET
jgi:hypothetical protein